MAETVPHTEPIDKNIVDRTIEITSKVLSYSFALSIVVTIYDVLQDVFFNAPTVWVYDVVTTAIAVAFLIGGSYALMRRDHIRITAVYARLARKTQRRGRQRQTAAVCGASALRGSTEGRILKLAVARIARRKCDGTGDREDDKGPTAPRLSQPALRRGRAVGGEGWRSGGASRNSLRIMKPLLQPHGSLCRGIAKRGVQVFPTWPLRCPGLLFHWDWPVGGSIIGAPAAPLEQVGRGGGAGP